MFFREKNELGYIALDENLIKQLVQLSISPYKDLVWLANYKGSSSEPMILLGGLESLKEIEIKMEGEALFIKIYIVIRFGESIKSICSEIIASLEKNITDWLEVPIDDIKIVVTGVLSKKLSKRNVIYSLREENE